VRRRWVLLGVALLVAVAVGIGWSSQRSIGCGHRNVAVGGRLLSAETGLPVAGAEVMTFPERSWADDPKTVAQFRSLAKEERELRGGRPSSFLCAVGTSDEKGEFHVVVEVPWSHGTNWFGVDMGPLEPPERHGVKVLRIDPGDGKPPRIVDVPKGEWQRVPDRRDDLWARWDLGDVRLGTAP
jgi:hypothetical protein